MLREWLRTNQEEGTYCTTSGFLLLKSNGFNNFAEIAWCLAFDFKTSPSSPSNTESVLDSIDHSPSYLSPFFQTRVPFPVGTPFSANPK